MLKNLESFKRLAKQALLLQLICYGACHPIVATVNTVPDTMSDI